MREDLKDEKGSGKGLPARSDGKSGAKAKLTVETFEEYLVKRRVGISAHEAAELASFAETLGQREYPKWEAWSLIVSVEQWRQARRAFCAAILLALAAMVVGLLQLVA